MFEAAGAGRMGAAGSAAGFGFGRGAAAAREAEAWPFGEGLTGGAAGLLSVLSPKAPGLSDVGGAEVEAPLVPAG